MDVDLSPKFSLKFFESDGGFYNIWSSSDLPILSEVKVGAGKLVLEPLGLALPHYADCSKIGFVVQGSGIVGLISPSNLKEKVVRVQEGDAIPVASEVATWWYNDSESSTFSVVFLGEARRAHRPGLFSYFFLAGANGVLGGFSTETLGRAWNLDEGQAEKLTKSQSGMIIVKVKPGKNMPGPREEDEESTVFKLKKWTNRDEALQGVASLTRKMSPLLGEIGLSGHFVKMKPTRAGLFVDSDVQVTYVVKGSGRVEMVDMDGRRVLDAKVEAGQVFVVPRYFTFAIVAEDEEIDCFTVITNPEPLPTHVVGMKSVLGNLSPQILEAAFNVSPQILKALTQ